jgi:hypothetical protein
MWAADFTNPGIVMPCNVSSILDLSTTYVGGTLVNYQDGREVLAFMFDWCGAQDTWARARLPVPTCTCLHVFPFSSCFRTQP